MTPLLPPTLEDCSPKGTHGDRDSSPTPIPVIWVGDVSHVGNEHCIIYFSSNSRFVFLDVVVLCDFGK